MNDASSKAVRPSLEDLRSLNGRVVLVKTSRDHRNPATAMRGFIEVREAAGSQRAVSIVVEFPQMFTGVAHHRTIPLDDTGLERLLASERNGAFEFTIDDELL